MKNYSNIPPKSKSQTKKGGNMKNKSNIPPNSKKRTKKIIKDHKKEQDLKGDFYALRPRRKMKNHKIKFNPKKFDFKGKGISLDAYPDLKPGMQMDQVIVLLSNSSPGAFVILTMFLRSIPMSCKLVLYLYEIKFLGQEIERTGVSSSAPPSKGARETSLASSGEISMCSSTTLKGSTTPKTSATPGVVHNSNISLATSLGIRTEVLLLQFLQTRLAVTPLALFSTIKLLPE